MAGSDVVKFADVAMWEAVPTSDGEHQVDPPRARLLYMTPDPLGSIAMANLMYEGKPVASVDDVTDEYRDHVIRDIPLTKLKAPFEFVDLHFLYENVDRGFTHQLVRQRTAVYVQESQRFAVKRHAALEVSQPPTIAGLKDDDPARVAWDKVVSDIGDGYNALIDAGIPAEDARGLLPTNITTRIHYKTNLRSLLDQAGVRLCTQAQFEWRLVWASMLRELREKHTDDRHEADGYHKIYRANDLLHLFRPICYQTGRCEFMGSGDRFCSIRDRVQANAAAGVKPSEWGEDHEAGTGELIPAIRPQEWLLDTRAARKAPRSR